MGAVYDVHVELSYQDEDAVVALMNDYIDENEGSRINFGVDSFAEQGITRDSVSGLMPAFLTMRGMVESDPGVFDASFDARYGWERVMTDMFEYIAPALDDGSIMEVYPDSGRDVLEVQGGEAVWLE